MMENKNFFLSLSLIVLVMSACSKKEDIVNIQEDSPTEQTFSTIINSATISDQYIVVLKKDAVITGMDVKGKKEHVKGKANGLLKKYLIPGEVQDVFETALEGFVVKMSPEQLAILKKDDLVKYVEADQLVYINARKTKPSPTPVPSTSPVTTTTPSQSIPWGVTRVGGGATYTGTNVVWVIDSGIDLTHPDLNVDQTRGISFISGVTSPNDDNGHGTHVAGTIAAIYNTIGVVGVAAGATVIPVKVLNSTGCGSFSVLLAGINYVAANGKAGDVANISISGGASPTIDGAVVTASALVKFAIASGNESDIASSHSPARAEGANIYTVSAMASGDSWAPFSNFGNGPVDYCSPGVSIYSTYRGGGYSSMTGTSMAAPHVAGLLLLGTINTSGHVSNDPDGKPDPIAHR